MKVTDKFSILNRLEIQVEKHLVIAVDSFQNLSDEVLLNPSNTGGWSIVQCLEHLNSYGQYYLPLFEKSLANNPDKPENQELKSSWLGSLAIESMDVTKNTKKYKALKQHQPSQQLDTKMVVAEFVNQQKRLLQILKIAYQKDIQKIKIPISITRFVKLNVGDALQFLIMHDERHILQASRNIAARTLIMKD